MKILSQSLNISIGVFIVFIANFIEHSFMPVIRDFEISKIEHTNTQIYISGWKRKERDCSFIGISAEGINADNERRDLKIVFQESHIPQYPIPIGKHTWGPWAIVMPVDDNIRILTLTATHRCHPAWNTTTELIELDIKNSYLDF